MPPRIIDSPGPLPPEEISALEQRLAVTLPDQYRTFLLTYNGGTPEPASFRFKRKRGAYSDSLVYYFLEVGGDEYSNLETEFRDFKIDRVRVPKELVPIAKDPFGNLVCIAVVGPQKGAVYFWDHDTEAEDGRTPTYSNVDLIADSFNEFLESLQ